MDNFLYDEMEHIKKIGSVEWPTKQEYLERKKNLNSPLPYEVKEYIEEGVEIGFKRCLHLVQEKQNLARIMFPHVNQLEKTADSLIEGIERFDKQITELKKSYFTRIEILKKALKDIKADGSYEDIASEIADKALKDFENAE